MREQLISGAINIYGGTRQAGLGVRCFSFFPGKPNLQLRRSEACREICSLSGLEVGGVGGGKLPVL